MNEKKIDTCVYASDFHFHFVRVSVFSFIESNKWFDGTIFMFVHPELPLSEYNIKQLRLIYPKIELVSIPKTPHLAQYSKNISSFSHQVSEYCKILAFSLDSPNLLYFSNTCLFRGEISSILTEETVSLTPEKSIIYISCKNNTSLEFNVNTSVDTFLDSQAALCGWKQVDNLVLSATLVKNNKFFQYRGILNKSRCIFYDRSIITSNSEHYPKMKQMWMHKNNGVSTWLMSPRNIEISRAKPTSIKFKEPHIKKILSHPISEIDQFINSAKLHESSSQYILDKNKLITSISEMTQITNNKILDSPIEYKYETACVIAFKDRHKILELNVKTLNEQSLKPAIILVASNIEDSNFANLLKSNYNNVFVVHHQNYPIGGKWRAGVKYAQKLKVNGVMILGSDDLLSLDYFKNCYLEIDGGLGSSGVGVDLIGNRRWLIYDIDKKLYDLEYLPNVPIFLGGGKMFSKYFLDSVNWEIFKKYRPFHLDEYGYDLVKKFSNKIKIISKDNFILSVKGNWEVINSTSAILNAKHRISSINITKNTKEIFNQLKITNIDDSII